MEKNCHVMCNKIIYYISTEIYIRKRIEIKVVSLL